MSEEQLQCRCHAPSTLDQAALDFMGDHVGAALLEILWRAKLFVLLRSGKFFDSCGVVVGKLADIFLAGHGAFTVSNPLRG